MVNPDTRVDSNKSKKSKEFISFKVLDLEASACEGARMLNLVKKQPDVETQVK